MARPNSAAQRLAVAVKSELSSFRAHVLKMSSCAHPPSERMCWIVRGGKERCGERCGKMCCGVGEMRGGGG